jgi:DNA polymerase-3 subunit delta
MPQVAMRAFKAALEQGTPDAVYLLHGDNEFLKAEKVRNLVDRLAEPATRDFNLEQLRGGEVDAGTLSSALDGLPLMASRRVVVLHDVGALKKVSRAALDRYLIRPSGDTVLVLVAAAGWKVDAALMGRVSSVEMKQLTEDETITWTIRQAARVQSQIEDEAARLLVRATGADLALIDGELRKLRDYAGGLVIGTDAVNAIVGVRAGETMSDLLDAVCARDGARAAGLVAVVLAQPKTTGVSLIMALTTHMLGLGQVLVARRNRAAPRQISQELYAILGESRSSVVGRPWGEAIAAWTQHADRWTETAVARALALLHAADGAMKESSLSSEEQSIVTLVLTMCHQRRSRAA